MGQRTVVQAAAFPDADALKRALKQNLSHLAQLGTTWHNLAQLGTTWRHIGPGLP